MQALARMALDVLSPTPMSAEPERVFSSAGLTLSNRRCRMGDDALQAIECLKTWFREGLVEKEIGKEELSGILEALHRAEAAHIN